LRFRRFRYSVSMGEVVGFVEGNVCVREFLGRYEEGGVTWWEKAVGLARFFKWLRVVKGLDLSPREFLDLHLRKRGAGSVEERRWALRLVLEYSRDNPDLRGRALHYVYSAWFLPVKLFCDFHEVPLTSTVGFFRKRNRRKHVDRPFTVELVKRILGVLSQRDRAVCMVMLQSGQSIKQVLVDMNGQAEYIIGEIKAGKERIRMDFRERKGNGFPYFTFISRDAIQELRKWLVIREQWLKNLGIEKCRWLFITKTGKRLTRKLFHNSFRRALAKARLNGDPYTVTPHGFRKFFEQEASPPDRGINKAYISFMMGHSTGNGYTHPLDAVGGTYDKAPWVYERTVEREYAKLEPYINIYSGKPASEEVEGLTRQQVEELKWLLETVRQNKMKILKALLEE